MLCNDLLFCTDLNTILSCEVDVPIFDKCHHNFIFGKVNISVSRPPVYIRDVCNYGQANVENSKYAQCNFNWSKAFKNFSIDGKFKHLNETLLNIFRNYIPNKEIKCDYCQSPWINDRIKAFWSKDLNWKKNQSIRKIDRMCQENSWS